MKLNRYNQPIDAPVTTMQAREAGLDFDNKYEIQTRDIRISNFVNNAGSATAVGTVTNGDSATVDVGLTSPFKRHNFAVPYVAIYQATSAVGSMQIYPSYGAGVANGDWAIASGFDWATWNGTTSAFAVNLENNSGGDLPIYAVADWKELRFTQRKGVNG